MNSLSYLIPTILFYSLLNFVGCNSISNGDEPIPKDSTITDSNPILFDDCVDSLVIIQNDNCLGASSIYLFHYLGERADSVISIQIDPDLLLIDDTCRTYNYDTPGIQIFLQSNTISSDGIYFNFCNDIGLDTNEQDSLYATGGSFHLSSDLNNVTSQSEGYLLSFQTENLKFESISDSFQIVFHKRIIRSVP